MPETQRPALEISVKTDMIGTFIKVLFRQQGLVQMPSQKRVSLATPIYKADYPAERTQAHRPLFHIRPPCSITTLLCRFRASLKMTAPDSYPDSTLTSLLHAPACTAPAIMSPCSSVNTLGMPRSPYANSHQQRTLHLPAPKDSLQAPLQGLPQMPTIPESILTTLLAWSQHSILLFLFPLWPGIQYTA